MKPKCPNCGSQNTEYLNEHQLSRASYGVSHKCKDCGKEFTLWEK